MSEDTTATSLCISIIQPTAEMQRADVVGFIQFLLHYIASRNNLRTLILYSFYGHQLDVFNQFVMAAAQSETIHRLCCEYIDRFPVQTLVELSRENRNIKVLFIKKVEFVSNNNVVDVSELASTTTLERLVLYRVKIERSAERMFSELALYWKPSTLELHGDVAKPLVSALMQLPVPTRLTMYGECNFEIFREALITGKAVMEWLSVNLVSCSDIQKKFSVLTKMIPDNLKVLFVSVNHSEQRLRPAVKKRFFRALDACTTLTRIHVRVVGENPFSPEEMLLLEDGRTGRNKNLSRLEEDPDTYPDKELLVLMLQMQTGDHLTGLFKVVRKIPAPFMKAAAHYWKEKRDRSGRNHA